MFGGEEGILKACVRCDTDLVVIASVGLEAFTTTLEAVKLGRDIAPASKEPFVFGSEVIVPLIKRNGVKVYPIDSEHSAVWQCVLEKSDGNVSTNGDGCIVGIDTSDVSRIWLGCSGGPFYGEDMGGAKGRDRRTGIEAPDLEHGRADNDQLRDPLQQGAGDKRGQGAVRAGARADRGHSGPDEHDPRDSRVQGWEQADERLEARHATTR